MALLKTTAGDVVAIPARKNERPGFVLSRVIYTDKVTCIEVFSPFFVNFSMTTEEALEQTWGVHDRLFNPIYAAFDFGRHFGKTKWPILAQVPNYDPEQQSGAAEIEFAGPLYEELGYYFKGRKEFQEPPETRRSLESMTIYSNPQLVHRINMHFAGILAIGEVCSAQRIHVLMEERSKSWWIEELSACVDLADLVGSKFKEFRGGKSSVR